MIFFPVDLILSNVSIPFEGDMTEESFDVS